MFLFASCLAYGVQHCSLLVIEWSWILALRWRSLGELLQFDITWSWEVSANVLNSALLPQRHRPDTRLEHQDPVSHMAQKREKERKREREEGRKGGREGREEGGRK